ncbi:protein kinase [Deinococcus malanensis]|uniref:protein kinase domain-containing protein n=1 Tax=Deinococcus malanensis TaxID=1706855 RepID=UPI0036416B9E
MYFAVDSAGQPRVVKIFPAHLATFAEREEAHASGLDHPRLARVIGRTEVDGNPALIGTLARGEVMFTRFAQRPAAVHERRAFLLTLAHVLDGLAYLHGHGLVHRDIKPENILVEPDGEPSWSTSICPVRRLRTWTCPPGLAPQLSRVRKLRGANPGPGE